MRSVSVRVSVHKVPLVPLVPSVPYPAVHAFAVLHVISPLTAIGVSVSVHERSGPVLFVAAPIAVVEMFSTRSRCAKIDPPFPVPHALFPTAVVRGVAVNKRHHPRAVPLAVPDLAGINTAVRPGVPPEPLSDVV